MPISYDNSPNSLLSATNKYAIGIVSILGLWIFFDFLIFLFLAETIKSVFFPKETSAMLLQLQIAVLFVTGYLARPLGGYMLGKMADQKGRKPALIFGLILMAVSTIAIGVLPSYAMVGMISPILFVIARIVQGFAFGGCVTNNWIFISEHTPKRHLFSVNSVVTSAYLLGLLMAVVGFKLYYNNLGLHNMISYGWRLPFFVAGVLTLFTVYALKNLGESPVYQTLQNQKTNTSSMTLNTPNQSEISNVSKRNLLFDKKNIWLCVWMTWVMSSISTIFEFSLPNIIRISFNIYEGYLYISSILGLLFMILGSIFFGVVADKTNPYRVLIIGLSLLIVQSFVLFFHLQAGGDFILVLYALFGFNVGIASLIPAMLLQLFRAEVRATSMGMLYNSTYAIIGGLLPFALTYSTTNFHFSTPVYLTLVCLVGIFMSAYLLKIPQRTIGGSLTSIDKSEPNSSIASNINDNTNHSPSIVKSKHIS